jgi:hypothetical protein
MSIPGLPFDNPFKFLFFAGLLIMIYSETFIEKNLTTTLQELETINYESGKLNISYKALNEDLKSLKEANENLTKELLLLIENQKKGILVGENDSKNIEKVSSELKNRFEQIQLTNRNLDLVSFEIESKNQILERKQKFKKNDELLYNFLISIGFICTIGGFTVWSIQHFQTETVVYGQYCKAVNENQSTKCLSCGMELKYSEEIRNGKYCSHCFGSVGFLQPEASLEEFKTLIKDRMIVQGFTSKQINRHLKAIGNLDRWKKVFKWS